MNQVDVKNSLKINKIVKKHFSLSNKYQKIFTERLLYKRDIAKEYSKIIGEDLRFRVTLDLERFKNHDSSYRSFTKVFKEYVEIRGATYSEFVKGKKSDKSGEIKMSKDIPNFYAEHSISSIKENINKIIKLCLIEKLEDLKGERNLRTILSLLHENLPYSDFGLIRDYAGVFYDASSVHISLYDYRSDFNHLEDFAFRFLLLSLAYDKELLSSMDEVKEIRHLIEENFKSIDKTFRNKISQDYKAKYESIATRKSFSSTDDYELVISLNYADWFLCSTGENWESCLSLDSNYDSCFWMGLPQLIGDKSRAMVYVTKKGTKKEYEGIVTDKIIFRSWIQLVRDKSNNKTLFSLPRQYPISDFKIDDVVSEILGIELLKDEGRNYVGRYYAENFFLKMDDSGRYSMTTIYLDNSSYKISKKNKGKYFPFDYGYYRFAGGCGPYRGKVSSISLRNSSSADFRYDDIIEWGATFTSILKSGKTVLHHINSYISGREDEDDYYEDDYEDEVM